MHDPNKPGWSQIVFDGAETVQDALGLQAGCEAALRSVLVPILSGKDEVMVMALIDSMALWRERAQTEIMTVQRVSFG